MIKRDTQSVCRLLFSCFLIVYMSVREVVPLQFLIANNYVSAAVFLCGFALIAWDVCTKRRVLRGQAVDLLLLFIVVCGISSLLNMSYGTGGNVKALGALVLEYGFLYASGVGLSVHQAKRDLCVISIVLLVIWGAFTLVSIPMYVFDIEYIALGGSQGFQGEYLRLWGIFQDPGYAGFISMIAIFAALFLMTQYRKTMVYVVCGLQIALQVSYIVLGGSRAALLLMLASIGMLGLYGFVFHTKRRFLTVFRGLLLTSGCVCIFALTVIAMQYVLPLCKTAVRTVIPDNTAVKQMYDGFYEKTDARTIIRERADGEIDFIHRTDTEKDDVSNGRFIRWKDTIHIFKHAVWFGTSPRNVSAFAQEHVPDTLMAKYNIAPHNGYLDVLVGSGVVGLSVLLLFFGIVVSGLIRRLIQHPFTVERAFASVSVFLLAGSAMFVSDIFFFFTAGAVWFWMMLGYVVHMNMPLQNGSILLRLCNGKKGERK